MSLILWLAINASDWLLWNGACIFFLVHIVSFLFSIHYSCLFLSKSTITWNHDPSMFGSNFYLWREENYTPLLYWNMIAMYICDHSIYMSLHIRRWCYLIWVVRLKDRYSFHTCFHLEDQHGIGGKKPSACK